MDLGLAGRRCVVTGASRGSAWRPPGSSAPRAPASCSSPATPRRLARGRGRGGSRGRGRRRTWPSTSPIRTPASGCWPLRASASAASTCSSTTPAPPSWRDLEDVPEEDWRLQFELNVIAPLRAMRAAAPRRWPSAAGAGSSTSASTAGKRPSAAMPEYSVAKAAELSLSRLFADRYAAAGRAGQRDLPGPGRARRCGWSRAACSTSRRSCRGRRAARRPSPTAGAKRPIGRLAEVGEIAAAIVFLCSERASYVAGAAWSVDGGTVQVII